MPPLADEADWAAFTGAAPPDHAQALLEAASGAVRAYCGWTISDCHVTGQVCDGDGSSLLLLPTLHLTAVEEMRQCGRRLAEHRDFTWSGRGFIQRQPRHLRWPRRLRAVTVSYRHGYDPVPAEIKAITVGLAARANSVPAGVTSEQVGGIRLTYAENSASMTLSSYEEKVLDRYRLAERP